MQKKIIALAIAAAFATPVVAMADVTMYGTMDGGLRHQTNDNIAQGTTDSMAMGQYNTARFGLKSVEDMGDGMKTNVVLETSYAPAGVGQNSDMNNNTNPGSTNSLNSASNNPFGLLFDRQATIGVSAGWGSFDMGWNYTTAFKVVQFIDPLNYKYITQYTSAAEKGLMAGAGQANAGARAGNLTYTGKFGDVTLLAEYDINDSGPTRQPSQQGTGRAIGAMYASGGVSLGGSYTAIESKAGVDAPITHVAVGGGYNFGDGSVKLGYSKKATKTAANDNTDTMMWLGGSFNVSNAVAVTAAYYSEAANTGAAGVADSTKKTARLGGTYALSKKTEFYLGLDRSVQNGGGAALDVVTVGTSAGLSTTF